MGSVTAGVELISAALQIIEDKAESVGNIIQDILINGEELDQDVLNSIIASARVIAAVSDIEVKDKASLNEALKEASILMITNKIKDMLSESIGKVDSTLTRNL